MSSGEAFRTPPEPVPASCLLLAAVLTLIVCGGRAYPAAAQTPPTADTPTAAPTATPPSAPTPSRPAHEVRGEAVEARHRTYKDSAAALLRRPLRPREGGRARPLRQAREGPAEARRVRLPAPAQARAGAAARADRRGAAACHLEVVHLAVDRTEDRHRDEKARRLHRRARAHPDVGGDRAPPGLREARERVLRRHRRAAQHRRPRAVQPHLAAGDRPPEGSVRHGHAPARRRAGTPGDPRRPRRERRRRVPRGAHWRDRRRPHPAAHRARAGSCGRARPRWRPRSTTSSTRSPRRNSCASSGARRTCGSCTCRSSPTSTTRSSCAACGSAIESIWHVRDGDDEFRVDVSFTYISPDDVYRRRPGCERDAGGSDCRPPNKGDKIDVGKHVGLFPPGTAVLTTGSNMTYAWGPAIVLGPQDAGPHLLAHEFGHMVGFRDEYFRGYRDLGPDGFQVMEVVAEPDDIMGKPGCRTGAPPHVRALDRRRGRRVRRAGHPRGVPLRGTDGTRGRGGPCGRPGCWLVVRAPRVARWLGAPRLLSSPLCSDRVGAG